MPHPARRRGTLGRLSALLLLLLACQLPGRAATPPSTPTFSAFATPTAAPQLPLSGSPQPLPEVASPPFAPLTFTPATTTTAPIYQPSLSAIANPVDLPVLSAEQQDFFNVNSFVLLDPIAAPPFELLARASGRGQPILLTADLFLYAAQMVQQAAWRQAEAEYLPVRLTLLTDRLIALTQLQAADEDEATAEAARRNLALLTVAARLLDPGYPADPAVAELVQSELALIAQGGQFISPLRGAMADYTPIAAAPAGYERALRWYQTAAISLDTNAPHPRRHGRQIQLLLAALRDGEAAAHWEPLAASHRFFEGNDAADPAVWGAMASASADLDSFILTARQLPAPAFYLLPPPVQPFPALTEPLRYNRVGAYNGGGELPFAAGQTAVGAVRLFPRSLDVAAALGSDAALAELGADADFVGYGEQLAGLRQSYVNQPDEAWGSTAAGSWLWVLQPLLAQSALGRWQAGWFWSQAELSPPSASPLAPAVGVVLIEADLPLIGRLQAYTRQMYDGLHARAILSVDNANRLLRLERLLASAAQLAVLQAEGRALTPAEREAAAALLLELQTLAADPTLPFAASLYTDPTTSVQVVGQISGVRPLYAIRLHEGDQLIVSGLRFEYEQQTRP